ncbi:ankyrin repeat domain-containing protein 61 [Echinops telfairi]|uniref:Ankyrin repeat domain-containing protein 61 n=1 Tax=Echinops telfairi TaxID=9371 RepID=A0ABM1VN45_ECHTE|nr:ankyrin repeat domain-containing protein 61 [Echinops telfairi]
MGNISRGEARRQGADRPVSGEAALPGALHRSLYKAILREDCSAIQTLLRGHPVDQPIAILADAPGHRRQLNQTQCVLPIHLAAQHHRAQSLLCLLQHGADPEARDTGGLTTLHQLLLYWPVESRARTPGPWRQKALADTPSNAEAQSRAACCLRILCEHGACVKAGVGGHGGPSPLHLAVICGASQGLSVLVQSGALVEAVNESCMTPLHVAASTLNRDMLETLMVCGADVNAVASTGGTALHLAVDTASGKAGWLLAAGVGCIHTLLTHGARVNAQDHLGQTALHKACFGGRDAIVSLLLEFEASVNILARDGESPIYRFLQRGSNIRNAALLARLLNRSYPLRLANHQGRLPAGIMLPEAHLLRGALVAWSQEPLALEDICKRYLRNAYGDRCKHHLKQILPRKVWHSVYSYQEGVGPLT